MAEQLQVLSSLIPRLVKEGVFGEGSLDSIEIDNDDVEIQFCSTLSMVKLRFRNDTNEIVTFKIVIKTQSTDHFSQAFRDCRSMFFNEVTMYKEVLPYLNFTGAAMYPRIYFGSVCCNQPISQDVLVLQNLKQLGYISCKEKVFLDYNHIAVGLKTLGKFHSWSYCAKQLDNKKFKKLANKLQLIELNDVEEFKVFETNYLCIKRGVNKVLEQSCRKEELTKFLKILKSVIETLRMLWMPDEPFGVIIHGDYCKNNLFYKYDSSGKPLEAAFFDLQNSRYGCPMTDLAFFLYLHTSPEAREKYWDEFLEIYWRSVRENVLEGIILPSYEEFLKHFAKKAVIGYIPVSFFLPVMVYDKPGSSESFLTYPNKEKGTYFSTLGGEKGQKLISEVVFHLLKKEYISNFLEYYNTKKH